LFAVVIGERFLVGVIVVAQRRGSGLLVHRCLSDAHREEVNLCLWTRRSDRVYENIVVAASPWQDLVAEYRLFELLTVVGVVVVVVELEIYWTG
jgi:hypothetical protein